ncbi:MAG TPA: endonuclease/exonuclease/phosphatase family protein [bacterium]|nr:endonuclease/exonuclease/phosphatase family protein [bacterium]
MGGHLRKAITSLLFFGWLTLLFIEAWVWGHVQDLFVPDHQVTQMIAGLLQDTLWIPPALALPGYLYFHLCRWTGRTAHRLLSAIALLAVTGWAALNLLNYFRILFFLLTLYFAVFCLQLRKNPRVRANVLFFTLALAGLVLHYRQQLIPKLGGNPQDTVSVLDYNIRINHRFEERQQVLDLIDRLQPDLVFIQEISRQDRLLFTRRFSTSHPHQIWADARENYNGGAILSKFRFLSRQNIDIGTEYSKGHFNLNQAVIEIKGEKIHLLNCHLFPSGHAFIELIAGQRSLASFIHDTRTTYQRRNREAERLAERVQKIQGRVILAGDFNDTPGSRVYELFERTLKNGFREAGWGVGATYGHYSLIRSLPPLLTRFAIDFLRIDHIFVSPDIHVTSAEVLPLSVSDHRAQFYRLRLE